MKMNPYTGKIKTVSQLGALCAKLKKQGKSVVLCHGVFDLMHPGHIKHLEAAKREGDVLFVTVTPDKYVNKGPGRPVFNHNLRAETVASLQAVDYAAVNEWPTAVETLRTIKPSIYVKGTDYAAASKDITGGISVEQREVEAHGGRIHFTDEITFSSTELLNKFFGVFSDETRAFLETFRGKYRPEDVVSALKSLSTKKVLVIGDTIVDEYHYCKGMGKSPKENIISTKFISEERFPGGVLACANHMAGFCGGVEMVTCLGEKDSHQEYISRHIKPNVRAKFFTRHDTCTVVKRRFVDAAFLNKLFEVSFLDDMPLPEKTSAEICRYLEKNAAKYDMVLVSDFGHGFIGPDIIKVLCAKAKFLAVNTQTNSANHGYNPITKYPRVDYICIDEPEIRFASHDKYGDIRHIIRDIAKRLKCSKVSVTRGHMGAITYDKRLGFSETPVFSDKIVDRVGAGDAFLSVTAPLVAAGYPMDLVGFVGNAVGAIKVGIVCNRASVEPVPLYKFIGTLLK